MWFRAYVVAWLLSGIGGAIYATYGRPYIAERLVIVKYSVVGLLLIPERIPSLASISSFSIHSILQYLLQPNYQRDIGNNTIREAHD